MLGTMESTTPTSSVFEYEFTRADYIRWLESLEQDQPDRSRKRIASRQRVPWILFLVGVPLFMLDFIRDFWQAIPEPDPSINGRLLFILGICYACLAWRGTDVLRATSLQAIKIDRDLVADMDHARRHQGRVCVTVTPSLFSARHKEFTISYRWACVERIILTLDLVRIVMSAEMQLAIPRHAIGDELAIKKFIETCNGYIAAEPSSRAQEVHELLADRDYFCPGCQYQLRGLKADKCPECARPIIVSEILATLRRRR